MNQIQTSPAQISRRSFMVGTSAMASGGLALGFHFPAAAQSNELSTLGGSEINAWVVVRPDDSCVIRIARAEMGQGTGGYEPNAAGNARSSGVKRASLCRGRGALLQSFEADFEARRRATGA